MERFVDLHAAQIGRFPRFAPILAPLCWILGALLIIDLVSTRLSFCVDRLLLPAGPVIFLCAFVLLWQLCLCMKKQFFHQVDHPKAGGKNVHRI